MANNTIYYDSKGRPHVIADMPYPYVKNVWAKLERNDETESTTGIAIKARLDALEAEYRANNPDA